MAWQSRPIFISSTFADMQAERDHLRTHVFPALEERLRTRRHHFEWVDLRLGVANASLEEGQQREMHVLKVCLAEVKRCRPFLIVLLGDRYGWVPPMERIEAAAREEGLEGELSGRSVTDLEISFGVLDDPGQQPRSFFYFREPLPCADMQPEFAALYADSYDANPASADRGKRLSALKQRIEAMLPDRVRRYSVGWDKEQSRVTDLEAWGRSVVEDVWADLEAEAGSIGVEEEITWQQAERTALDDYAEERARDFVRRGHILSHIQELASSPPQQGAAWGLCLTGAPGSGKSAIFGEVYRRLRQSNVFVLAHAAAASAHAPSVEDMLRRWIEELGTSLDIDPGLADNADPDMIETTFHSLLNRLAARRRVVVLVDALDQFEGTAQGRFVTWLPRAWPANARLIATAVPGEASQTIARSGLETLPLQPLDITEARRITTAICDRYHRILEPEVVDTLLAKRGDEGPAWRNTLWLVLAVEELNLVDADDFARAKRAYAVFRRTDQGTHAGYRGRIAVEHRRRLYRAAFERAESLSGISLARAFLGFIAAGRTGWRETDFRALLPRAAGEPWDGLRFASLRRMFRGQIRQRGVLGQWDFNHAQMRAAVHEHLAAKGVSEIGFHAGIADHLLSLPADDPLRQSETMVHLLGAEDWPCAAAFYGSSSLSEAELEGATRVLTDAVLTSHRAGMEGLDQVLHLLDAVAIPQDAKSAAIAGRLANRLLFHLDGMLAERAGLSPRTKLIGAIRTMLDHLATADPSNVSWQRDLSVSHDKIGNVLSVQGNLPAALAAYNASLAITERLTSADPLNAVWQSDLSIFHSRNGDVLVAQGNLPAALEAYNASLAICDRLAKADPGNAVWQSDLTVPQEKIGEVLVKQGNLPAALKSYSASLVIRERLAKADPGNAVWQSDLTVPQDRIGDVMVKQGNLAAALESYRASLAIWDRLAKADPVNAGWQRNLTAAQEKIGNVMKALGDLPAALESYCASLAIRDRLAKTDPGNAGWQSELTCSLENIGDVLVAQGNLGEALSAYNSSLAIGEGLAMLDPGNAGWQRHLAVSHIKIGDVMVDQGNLPAALESYRASLAIADRLANNDPGNAVWQSDVYVSLLRLADVAISQGYLFSALAYLRNGHEILDRLAEADPSNAVSQSRLSVAQEKIGDVLVAQGDVPAALESYCASLAIRERLAKADPGNAGWQSDLTAAQDRIGNVMEALGDLPAALESYCASLAIRERLATADPSNVGWRRDIALSYGKIAAVEAQLGRRDNALSGFQRGRDIIARLSARSPNNARLPRYLAWFEQNIADLEDHDENGDNGAALGSSSAEEVG